jgi:tRNA-specific 2-thiouridylase
MHGAVGEIPSSLPLLPTLQGRGVVAMSGGVDSSTVAAMLAHEGHELIGISMRLYAEERAGRSCCSPDDLLDAREVAEAAGFPFYVANLQTEFEERVVRHFVDEYRRGRTPSPCVLCNDHLKFDALFARVDALGAQWLATGHYARLEPRDDRIALLRGVDRSRDQSYFLSGLPRDQLPRIRFPLGGMLKSEVRARAAALGLRGATKAESQDICFVGGRSYVEFVERRLRDADVVAGEIRREGTGEVLGRHAGIHRFTVGQRRGLGVATGEPLYVRRIEPESGTVWVGNADEVRDTVFRVERCNWLRWAVPPGAFACVAQVRYRHAGVPARVSPLQGGAWQVELERPEPGIAPGQVAVFYEGDEVLGGGWIEAVG